MERRLIILIFFFAIIVAFLCLDSYKKVNTIRNKKEGVKLKLGIALSGGGIRGIAHAGVLKALEDNDIKIDVIGGTSSGSIIAASYAMGYSPYYIYVMFKRYAKEVTQVESSPIITGIGNFIFNKKVAIDGFKTGENIEEAYKNIALKKGVKKISDVSRIPLVIPAVDIVDSEKYIFTNKIPKNCNKKDRYITDIPIGKAVRASSSFPCVFSPCDFKKHKFLDGGVLDNVPVQEVRKQGADKVIAINFKADDVNNSSNVMDIVMRTVDIMGNKISEENLENSDYVLTVKTDKTGLLDVEKLDNCYSYGYKAVTDNIEEIKKILY